MPQHRLVPAGRTGWVDGQPPEDRLVCSSMCRLSGSACRKGLHGGMGSRVCRMEQEGIRQQDVGQEATMKRALLFIFLAVVSAGAMAQRPDGGSADRWNVTGPAWYQAPCGHVGFSPTHGIPYQKWVRPCSVPIRVCEFKTLTLNF